MTAMQNSLRQKALYLIASVHAYGVCRTPFAGFSPTDMPRRVALASIEPKHLGPRIAVRGPANDPKSVSELAGSTSLHLSERKKLWK
jgi:hypothetical protein